MGELTEDGCCGMGVVDGVDPEDLAAVVLSGLTEDLDGEVLGEVVGPAGLAPREIGDVVLAQDGLAVDCDEWLGGECAEVGVGGDLA